VAVNGVCAISAVHIGRRYGLKRSKSSVASSNDEAILWTCVEVVQHYINRVQAYNGVSRCTTRCSLSLSQGTALAMSRLLRTRQPRFQSLGCPSRSYLGRTLAARMSFWRSRLLTKQLPSAASIAGIRPTSD